jgi:hypothetical protein
MDRGVVGRAGRWRARSAWARSRAAAATGPTWFAPDGTTEQGEDAYLVVMNPFAVDAVFDVVLYTPKRAPIRNSALTDHVLRPGKSVAFRLNAFAEGEAAVGAEVDVSLGRVAVSSLGITRDGGIRSVIGTTATGSITLLPVGGGAGQSTVDVVVPGEDQLDFGATLLSSEAPVPAGGLTEASQNPTSARPYPVTFSGPSSVHVVAQGDGAFAASLRSVGVGNDDGATGGVPESASSWVVLPAIAGEPSRPRIVLVNPGNTTVTVTFHALAAEGDTAPPDATLTIEPGSVDQVPPGFLEGIHGSAGRDPLVRWRHPRPRGVDVARCQGPLHVRAGDGSAHPLSPGLDACRSTEPVIRGRSEPASSLSSMFPSLSSWGTTYPRTASGDPMARGRHVKHARSAAFVVAIAVGIVLLALGGVSFAAYRYDQASSDRILPACRSPARTSGA